ncbi:bifunctional 4-hydroxy-2-oxoglutarate aldolase/2-dehydro-3-deoxy-phosphogluconate aldolase [Geodermatophilus maliterrae]|uniref:Bifunctional 4-hydroxy-2-oxoglutarate aldolase/2-dehydro-3-deoxy-phosphogluconate aldolase n=1 Tax=Geodermatophilus maliterrae TaxID=3162531 RepID=A0ABV3XCE3_9ACTN
MELHEVLQEQRVLAVLRGDDAAGVVAAAEVLAGAGIGAIEVTWTVADAERVVTTLRERLPSHVIGAGTLTTPGEVARAVGAGAQFVVSPGSPAELLDALLGSGVPALPGVLTPGEVVAATAAGATAVKLFPAGAFGPGYLGQLRGPFPTLEVVPTGGIDVPSVGDWIARGALAVGLSTALCSHEDVRRRDWGPVEARAHAALRSRAPG